MFEDVRWEDVVLQILMGIIVLKIWVEGEDKGVNKRFNWGEGGDITSLKMERGRLI